MSTPFFECIPHWMSDSVKNKPCSKCGYVLDKQNIMGAGVKQIGGEHSVFVEFRCPKCNYEARFSFENIVTTPTVERLCYMLLEEIQKKKRVHKAMSLPKNQRNNNPITDKEVKDFVREMNNSENYEDFLKLISAHQLIEPDNQNEG